ncbi:MAG: hypothetical protein A3F67_00600 [Verrucomicrobia bacterium RIFCSPHIGHO2_12_FULL_41_10]|nr:MAG: hypothetical protein A3F67_00600 [Verrucomicrobia bacterium RIFCSPHIGHO2_12_FULL_41_10]
MFDTRIEMIKALIPENSILCELGVFKGDFASELYKLNPKHLYLCDLWPNAPLYSGNEDGRHGEFYNGVDLYEHVSCRFYDNLNISIYRECSDTFIKKLPDAFLDGVYIDANHSYDAVKSDLNAIFPKMKYGGVIMGHDYECNPAKASELFETGVKQAVDEFCKERNLEINAKANDGCVSFAIFSSIR